jgi:hypothetical protein
MKTDEIMTELHRIKDEIAAEHDRDVRKLVRTLVERQKRRPGRVVVTKPPEPAR